MGVRSTGVQAFSERKQWASFDASTCGGVRESTAALSIWVRRLCNRQSRLQRPGRALRGIARPTTERTNPAPHSRHKRTDEMGAAAALLSFSNMLENVDARLGGAVFENVFEVLFWNILLGIFVMYVSNQALQWASSKYRSMDQFEKFFTAFSLMNIIYLIGMAVPFTYFGLLFLLSDDVEATFDRYQWELWFFTLMQGIVYFTEAEAGLFLTLFSRKMTESYRLHRALNIVGTSVFCITRLVLFPGIVYFLQGTARVMFKYGNSTHKGLYLISLLVGVVVMCLQSHSIWVYFHLYRKDGLLMRETMAASQEDSTSKAKETIVQNLGTWSLRKTSSIPPIEEVKDAAQFGEHLNRFGILHTAA
eukprot:jgi/Bigna1/72496/fgenesh1_pg.20_\